MKQVTQSANTYTFAYNGLGDRLSQTVGITTTRYVLDPGAGLTQVLSDGTNMHLYGNGRLAQYQTAMQYFGADGLRSVRQLYDASGQVIATDRYDPYGNLMSHYGDATSVFGFTGEQLDPTGLEYLRARYYSSAQGRFTTRDTLEGAGGSAVSSNQYSYAEDNPTGLSDPSGLDPNVTGAGYFAMCFELHSLPTHGAAYPGLYGGVSPITAGQAVDVCKAAYNKGNWNKDVYRFTLGSSLPTSAHELMGWYVNEHRLENRLDRLYFSGAEPLTRELATSILVNEVRAGYYQSGDTDEAKEYRFNHAEYIKTFSVDSWASIGKLSLPISFFIGSFWYQVRTVSTKGQDERVGFRIDNDTTLESGTHIQGRFRQEYTDNVEDLIENDRTGKLATTPLYELIRDTQHYKLISILRPRTKEETEGLQGGGNLYQTFTWTEKRDPCLANQLMPLVLPAAVRAALVDVRPWIGYEYMTQEPRGFPLYQAQFNWTEPW